MSGYSCPAEEAILKTLAVGELGPMLTYNSVWKKIKQINWSFRNVANFRSRCLAEDALLCALERFHLFSSSGETGPSFTVGSASTKLNDSLHRTVMANNPNQRFDTSKILFAWVLYAISTHDDERLDLLLGAIEQNFGDLVTKIISQSLQEICIDRWTHHAFESAMHIYLRYRVDVFSKTFIYVNSLDTSRSDLILGMNRSKIRAFLIGMATEEETWYRDRLFASEDYMQRYLPFFFFVSHTSVQSILLLDELVQAYPMQDLFESQTIVDSFKDLQCTPLLYALMRFSSKRAPIVAFLLRVSNINHPSHGNPVFWLIRKSLILKNLAPEAVQVIMHALITYCGNYQWRHQCIFDHDLSLDMMTAKQYCDFRLKNLSEILDPSCLCNRIREWLESLENDP